MRLKAAFTNFGAGAQSPTHKDSPTSPLARSRLGVGASALSGGGGVASAADGDGAFGPDGDADAVVMLTDDGSSSAVGKTGTAGSGGGGGGGPDAGGPPSHSASGAGTAPSLVSAPSVALVSHGGVGATSSWLKGTMLAQLDEDGGVKPYVPPHRDDRAGGGDDVEVVENDSGDVGGGGGHAAHAPRRGRVVMTHALPPNPGLGRPFPAPYVRLLKNPRCIAVDAHGTVFVGVGLSSAVGTTWFGTGSLANRGLTYSGLKIRNPESTGGVCAVSVLTSASGSESRLTGCCLDSLDTLFWARGGRNVVITDPWLRWRTIGPIVMLRFLFQNDRATREVIIGRRIMSKDRASTRAAQWAITLPPHLQSIFQRVYSFYS